MTRSGKWRRKRSAEWPLLSYGSPITSVLRAAAMTSFVTTLSPLIFMMRSIWVNRSWGWSTASSDPSGRLLDQDHRQSRLYGLITIDGVVGV